MLSGYGSGFVYISRELQERSRLARDWLVEVCRIHTNMRKRRSAFATWMHPARAELGCPNFAGIFALGVSVQDDAERSGFEKFRIVLWKVNRYLTNA